MPTYTVRIVKRSKPNGVGAVVAVGVVRAHDAVDATYRAEPLAKALIPAKPKRVRGGKRSKLRLKQFIEGHDVSSTQLVRDHAKHFDGWTSHGDADHDCLDYFHGDKPIEDKSLSEHGYEIDTGKRLLLKGNPFLPPNDIHTDRKVKVDPDNDSND